MNARSALVLDDDATVICLSHVELMDAIDGQIAHPASRPLAVCSVNIDHLHHFGAGRAALGNDVEWVLVADGAPIAHRAARLARHAWPRVTGADLLPDVIARAAERGWRVGFVGGTTEMHQRLEPILQQQYPQLRIAGFWSPERAELDDADATAALVAHIRTASPTVLVVGLGKPRQERWIDEVGPRTGAEVLLPFGAAADFMAGMVTRAPEGWRNSGFEWLYRLLQEPGRLARRYLLQGPPALLRLRKAKLGRTTWTRASRPGGRSRVRC